MNHKVSIMRVNVVGTSGCGKSTFSIRLAEVLKTPYIEIDKVYWRPEWRGINDDELFNTLEKELSAPGWVLDGNYTRTAPIKWKNVQMVIWLDYSFPRVIYQVMKRALWRSFIGKELWPGTGNKESFKKLFSRDSIVLWSIETFKYNRIKYNETMQDKNFKHISFIRLANPNEAKHFLINIQNS